MTIRPHIAILGVILAAALSCARSRSFSKNPQQAPIPPDERRAAQAASCGHDGAGVWDPDSNQCYDAAKYCEKFKKDHIWRESDRRCLSPADACRERGNGSDWNGTTCRSAEELCADRKDGSEWIDGKCITSKDVCTKRGERWKNATDGQCILKTFTDFCQDQQASGDIKTAIWFLREFDRLTCEEAEAALLGKTKLEIKPVRKTSTKGDEFVRMPTIDPLISFPQLKELYLNSNAIADISALEAFVNLERLDLSLNQAISNVKPLAALKKLQYLNLTRNAIKDVSPLAELDQLTDLRIDNNPIDSIASLVTLVNLVRLDLQSTRVDDFSSIRKMTKLQKLSFDGNIRLIRDVAHCPTDLENGVPYVLVSFCLKFIETPAK